MIFVHGLGSNPDTTWTARENPSAEPVNWVTDLLPQELDIELRRTTRVFFFNYDSNWRRDALRFRLKHISDGLLSSLRELGERNAAVRNLWHARG